MSDLPCGYRWATGEGCEAYARGDFPGATPIVIRTYDSEGRPYTEGEAELAVPDSRAYINAGFNEDGRAHIVATVEGGVSVSIEAEVRDGHIHIWIDRFRRGDATIKVNGAVVP
jgi:hypothetical protein